MSSPQASLTGIPPELRLRIYEYAIADNDADEQHDGIIFCGTAAGAPHRCKQTFSAVALRDVCRLIRKEVLSLPTFNLPQLRVIFNDCTHADLEAWLDALGEAQVAQIRRFTITLWGACVPSKHQKPSRITQISSRSFQPTKWDKLSPEMRPEKCKRAMAVDFLELECLIKEEQQEDLATREPIEGFDDDDDLLSDYPGYFHFSYERAIELLVDSKEHATFKDCGSHDPFDYYGCDTGTKGLHHAVFSLVNEGGIMVSRESLLDIRRCLAESDW